MDKKKILIFIDWFLPGERSGGPVRSVANMIDSLSDEYEFAVVTRNTDYTSSEIYTNVRSNEWNTLPDGKRVYYISHDQLERSTIIAIIQQEAPHRIYVNGIWSQPFTRWPLEIAAKRNIPVIVGVRGMLASSALAIRKTKKSLFLFFAKWKGLFDGVTFHATTEQEANETAAVFGVDSRIKVAGNLPRKKNSFSEHTRPVGPIRVISIARIAPEKNTLFALEVLKQCKSPVVADFYGPVYDADYRKQCESMLVQMPSHVKVTFHDAVPSDRIPELYASHDVLLLPSRGENFGHSILEALQNGVPVVISDRTPWRGLSSQQAGYDLPLSDQSSFASRIDELAAMDSGEFQNWIIGAREVAAKYVSASGLLDASRKLFD